VHKYNRETVVLLCIHRNIERERARERERKREKILLTSQRCACSPGNIDEEQNRIRGIFSLFHWLVLRYMPLYKRVLSVRSFISVFSSSPSAP